MNATSSTARDDDYMGFPPDQTPLQPEAINAIVNDARTLIETATLANPDEYKSFEWKQRPSTLRQIAVEHFLNPPPPWGLRVNLASLYIGPEHCNTIAQSMLLCKTVTSLDLSMCDMQTESAVYLFKCLKGRNKVLRHLNLNGNFIDPPGGVAAATCVGQLESLHLACNNIGDVGCIAISHELRRTNTMKFLNVRANNITNVGIHKLLEALSPEAAEAIDLAQFAKPAIVIPRDVEVVPAATQTLQAMMAGSTSSTTLNSPSGNQAAAAPSSPIGSPQNVSSPRLSSVAQPGQRRQSRLYTTAIIALAGASPDLSSSPRGETIPFLDRSVKNTSINALWVQLNKNVARVLEEQIVSILAARFPQPPEGFNDKKKKGKKGLAKK